MNTIKFQCPACSQHLEIAQEMRGTFTECPTCHVGNMVPTEPSPPDEAVAAEAGRVGGMNKRSRRIVLNFTIILVAGLVGAFIFVARAGKPSPHLPAQHGVALQRPPAAIESSANSPESLTTDMLYWLPESTRKTILAEVGDGSVTSLNQSIQEGVTVFEVEFTKDNLSRSLSVDANGNLLTLQVLESDLPLAVRTIFEKEFPGASFLQIEREPDDDGKYVYAMELTLQGRTDSLTIGQDGDWWSLELELEQTPAPVKQAVGRLWNTSIRITGARKAAQEGEVSFEVDGEKDGLQHRLTFSPSGEVMARQDETTIDLVPLPVKNSVNDQVGAGKIVRIVQVTCEGAVSYDVTAVKDTRSIEFRVNPAGEFLESDN